MPSNTAAELLEISRNLTAVAASLASALPSAPYDALKKSRNSDTWTATRVTQLFEMVALVKAELGIEGRLDFNKTFDQNYSGFLEILHTRHSQEYPNPPRTAFALESQFACCGDGHFMNHRHESNEWAYRLKEFLVEHMFKL